MVYTCYEMIRDCRADKPEGWRYFACEYIPLIRKMLDHYTPGAPPALLEAVLLAVRRPESSLFQSMEPAPERWFVAELRQKVLGELPLSPAQVEVDLETVAAALAPLTLREKQVAWIETMGYDDDVTGAMLRMAPHTVGKVRDRASELLRGAVDSWRRTVLADNGRELGRAASAGGGKDCLPSKMFLDVLDGRTTWRGRETMEQHVNSCWHCVDHFARMAEVIELIRGVRRLEEAEAEPFYRVLGVSAAKKSFWKRG